MAISEAARNDLYTGLREVLGDQRAETLMSVVPLHDLDEVATKRDIAGSRAAMSAEVAALRADMAELRAELKIDIAELRAEIKSDMASFQKTMSNWMLTLMVTIVGAMAGTFFLN